MSLVSTRCLSLFVFFSLNWFSFCGRKSIKIVKIPEPCINVNELCSMLTFTHRFIRSHYKHADTLVVWSVCTVRQSLWHCAMLNILVCSQILTFNHLHIHKNLYWNCVWSLFFLHLFISQNSSPIPSADVSISHNLYVLIKPYSSCVCYFDSPTERWRWLYWNFNEASHFLSHISASKSVNQLKKAVYSKL